jgi:hypothetical protein
MTPVSKILIGAATAAGVAALSIVSASAAIVCTGDVCWHTHTAYDYPPGRPCDHSSGHLEIAAERTLHLARA